MKLSTKSRYGVRMMADLADHYGRDPVFLKDIAKREEISEKYLSIIVIPLRSAGLIKSTRGAHGGYLLAQSPAETTLRSILDALGEKICLVDCIKNLRSCSRAGTCSTRDVWSVLSEKIRETLDSITLADLVQTRRKKAADNIMNNI
ncbi:MAG TPA: Rrf2 family transcriptional regulator [Smithellaceae bacterium]|nr:Rrf2 family transcriptional regulator [Smithellaceae bacterium]